MTKQNIRISRYLCIFALLFPCILTSCSSEDTPQVDFRNPTSYFVPADNDQSQEAQLRRKFYSDNGVYLIFNDTLQHKYLGKDINGDDTYFTETIDIGYNVGQTSSSTTTYKYYYLTTTEQEQKGIDFAEDYILNHLTGKLRPFSLFICNAIIGNSNGTTLRPYAMSNQRCMIVSISYLLAQERSDAQKKQLAQLILNIVIGQMAENNSNAFSTFFSYSSKYYGANYSDFGMTGTNEEAQSVGFLSKGSSAGSFPTQSSDLSTYVTQAIQLTEEQFNTKYAGKDICIAKFAEVKRVLEDLGYKY